MQNEAMIAQLNDTLTGLKIDAECIGARQSRHFGFYDVKLGFKCRVKKLEGVAEEIALRIKSRTTPIVRPLRDQGIVRLQVVNSDAKVLDFASTYPLSKGKGMMPFLFGETDEGEVLWNDMTMNPHMLVAGSTGSGKSVFLHVLVANAVRTSRVRLYLVDPKGVEFAPYRHASMKNVVWNISQKYDETIYMLEGLIDEMEQRYAILQQEGFSSLEQAPWMFDKILVVIDEVADIILLDGRSKRFENLVVKLAQKSRAAGIYLTLATQRPSVDVLTGLIKANFEARLSFKVTSQVDSRVILDHSGAEHLVDRGDAIFKNRAFNSVRLQTAFVRPQDTVQYCVSNPHRL